MQSVMMNNNEIDVKTEDKEADEVNGKKVVIADNFSQTDAVEFEDFGTNTEDDERIEVSDCGTNTEIEATNCGTMTELIKYKDVLRVDPHGKIYPGEGLGRT